MASRRFRASEAEPLDWANVPEPDFPHAYLAKLAPLDPLARFVAMHDDFREWIECEPLTADERARILSLDAAAPHPDKRRGNALARFEGLAMSHYGRALASALNGPVGPYAPGETRG